MKNRNPIAVALLPFVTFGIYSIYWEVKTKQEMKALGADIPTAWLIIVPLVNYWWLWKYSQGVEKVTGGKLQSILAFLLLALLGTIGAAIVQDSFNNNLVATTPTGLPATPVIAETPYAPEAPVVDTNPVPPYTPPVPTPVPPSPTPPIDTPPVDPIQ